MRHVHDCVGQLRFRDGESAVQRGQGGQGADEGRPALSAGPAHVDNANYLWIQIFYSALNETGRAGFVMANSASDARGSELEIRRKLIEAGVVDVMVAIGSNFFYTVTLPCTLWFFDKGKRATPRRRPDALH